jgi:preprotein translocase subunit SecA
MLGLLKKLFGSSQERIISRFQKIVKQVNQYEQKFSSLTDDELKAKTQEFRKRYQEGASLDALLPEAYGAIKVASARLRGTEIHVSGYNQRWDMVPYDVQVLGAIAMHYGFISEMQTGEGKTLTATMPLYLNAISQKPVHLVTVNDYLAKRDCEWVGTLLRWMGITTAVLTNDTQPHERGKVYKADVVYGTASEFGFDYLRDNSMVFSKEEQVQRGFFFSIIDEIDSILIDEARTPLIISGPTPNTFQMYDSLKDDVARLVKLQKEKCRQFAREAQTELDDLIELERIPQTKEERKRVHAACKKLWLVSKGLPNHKIVRRANEHPELRSEIDNWDLYFHNDQNKDEKAEVTAQLLMLVDEKGNDFELTDLGISSWVDVRGTDTADFMMLDLGHEYALVDSDESLSPEEKTQKKVALNEEDSNRKERAHNIRQLLRAHLLMEKDVDYIVAQDKIVIIDENTGRPQPGRRFSNGLHQAIEAKEGLEIQKETQTYATITLQNYFRMYDKLAGMTGTAITEAHEFKEIYKLDVLQIPTYKPCKRVDENDEIYMTEREKYHAILKEIKDIHAKGRPILIGTESVEVSEKISRILRQNSIPHTVLNAKQNDQEAEIISEAGSKGAVTVATNMAGRGTDIKLKEGVANKGGLHVIGTTRHQSRRIDRQLTGRSARLGDPGSSKFYISFEDPLMRLFASPRMAAMIKRFRPPEGEPISAGILNHSIQTAQKRVEGRNYMIRKHTLEYDDVMNRQRQEVYSFRNEVLHTDNMAGFCKELLENLCHMLVDQYFVSRSSTWDIEGFLQACHTYFPLTLEENTFDDDHSSKEEILDTVHSKVVHLFEEKIQIEMKKILSNDPQADARGMVEETLRSLIIRKVDELWQEHLLVMDHLRSEVSLRTVAQKDPLMEFKHEAFRCFHDLSQQLHTETCKDLFRIRISVIPHGMMEAMLSQMNMEKDRSFFPEEQSPINPIEEQEPMQKALPVQSDPKIGRNDMCPCNSGKKFKKCCGLVEETV